MATKRTTKRKPAKAVKKAVVRKSNKKLTGSKLTAALKQLFHKEALRKSMRPRTKSTLSDKAIGKLQEWCKERGYEFTLVPT